MLTLIYGPMTSGKTQELHRRVSLHCDARAGAGHTAKTVLCIVPACDTRASGACLSTHRRDTNHSVPPHPMVDYLRVEKLSDVKCAVTDYELVAIDEGQFFGDLDGSVRKWLQSSALEILVAGLKYDAWRKPFPGSQLELIEPLASDILHLKARCVLCVQEGRRREAPFSAHRVPPAAECDKIRVGGTEVYMALCAACYNRHYSRPETPL